MNDACRFCGSEINPADYVSLAHCVSEGPSNLYRFCRLTCLIHWILNKIRPSIEGGNIKW